MIQIIKREKDLVCTRTLKKMCKNNLFDYDKLIDVCIALDFNKKIDLYVKQNDLQNETFYIKNDDISKVLDVEQIRMFENE